MIYRLEISLLPNMKIENYSIIKPKDLIAQKKEIDKWIKNYDLFFKKVSNVINKFRKMKIFFEHQDYNLVTHLEMDENEIKEILLSAGLKDKDFRNVIIEEIHFSESDNKLDDFPREKITGFANLPKIKDYSFVMSEDTSYFDLDQTLINEAFIEDDELIVSHEDDGVDIDEILSELDEWDDDDIEYQDFDIDDDDDGMEDNILIEHVVDEARDENGLIIYLTEKQMNEIKNNESIELIDDEILKYFNISFMELCLRDNEDEIED